MDIAKSLVKCVARGFYEVKHILVLDALIIHNAIRDDELAKLLGLQTKDLHKLCGKLREDRMLTVHTQPEQRENQQRPVNRTYYYIDYRATIDAVKYRMHQVVKEVEKKMSKDADTKGYVCPRCNKRFTVLDAMSLDVDDNDVFVCDRCSYSVVDDDDSAEVKSSQERLGRLMNQTKKIVEFLKKIDEVVVPANDWEQAFANAVPVPKERNQLSGAAGQNIPVTVIKKAGSGPSQPSLEVSITSTSEKSAAELAAEQLKKQQQAEKNALPVWHTESTVTSGAATNAGLKEAAEKAARERDGLGVVGSLSGVETKEPEDEVAHQAAIAKFYASLNAEEDEEEEEEEEDDDDDEEEEVEFEDVGTSAAPTPAPVAGNFSNPASVGGNDTGSEEDSDLPSRKRQKTIEPSPLAQPPAGEEDSEEEADFEDV